MERHKYLFWLDIEELLFSIEQMLKPIQKKFELLKDIFEYHFRNHFWILRVDESKFE